MSVATFHEAVAVALPPSIDPRRHPPDDAFLRLLPRRDGASVALPDGLTYVFIVFVNRSGSTYLAELLASTGFFNVGKEALNPEAAVLACNLHGWGSLSAYFAETAAREARNGYFVAKATIGQLAVLDWHGLLPRILPSCRFLVIERMDKLAQAISWSIANQTGQFVSLDGQRGPLAAVYDGEAVRRDLARVVDQHAEIGLFMALNGLTPFHLSYETLTAEPSIAGALACQYLGQPHLTCNAGLIRLARQATSMNDDWRARFLAERDRLKVASPSPSATPRATRYQPASLAELAALPVEPGGVPRVRRRQHLPPAALTIPKLAFGDSDLPRGATDADAVAGGRVTFPAMPAWVLRDAVVHGKQGIVTLGAHVVTESLRQVSLSAIPGAAWDADGALSLPERRPMAPIGTGCHLLTGELENYLSWLLAVLGRFSSAVLAMSGAEAPILLLPPLDVFWKWESLGLVVADDVPRLSVSPSEQVAVRRLLYVPDLGDGGDTPHPAALPLFDAVRHLAIGDPVASWRPNRRLFVARGQIGDAGLSNEPAVFERLQRAGFARVVPAELSVIEQARLFAEASHIVAVHGAELANVAFCHPGARLCEVRPPGVADWRIRRLAALRGVPYGCLIGRAGEPAAGWTLDPARLDALLADAAFR
jgi:LPS sulfotransferase NodH/capsular polysaccharide biosynthesis protein